MCVLAENSAEITFSGLSLKEDCSVYKKQHYYMLWSSVVVVGSPYASLADLWGSGLILEAALKPEVKQALKNAAYSDNNKKTETKNKTKNNTELQNERLRDSHDREGFFFFFLYH